MILYALTAVLTLLCRLAVTALLISVRTLIASLTLITSLLTRTILALVTTLLLSILTLDTLPIETRLLVLTSFILTVLVVTVTGSVLTIAVTTITTLPVLITTLPVLVIVRSVLTILVVAVILTARSILVVALLAILSLSGLTVNPCILRTGAIINLHKPWTCVPAVFASVLIFRSFRKTVEAVLSFIVVRVLIVEPVSFFNFHNLILFLTSRPVVSLTKNPFYIPK